MVLWFLDVDCQRDKGRFTIGVGFTNGLAENIKNMTEINSFEKTLFKNMFCKK